MPTSNEIELSYQGRIAIITLNRPSKLNALDADLYYELGEKLREVAARDDIYITILTGRGRYFSAGADVRSTKPSTGNSDIRRQIVRNFVVNNLDITRAFYNHPKILIMALNGPAVGLSAALTAFGDFIYAAPHTFLLTPFSSLGLVTEGGASRAFVERLGISKANEALLMSKRIPIEDLVSTGFVNKVIIPSSGRQDDSDEFLKLVLEEVEDRLGKHLNQDSLLKMKSLIRMHEREILDRQNVHEVFMGMERFLAGIPQEEFRKIAAGEKKHKL
ncbi:dodecenoyl-CoA isomerase [Ophidiomyces ophidiicola]|uniref:Dodecenoyl-CoA isomerase n=1 Tax=Ophidiomyces ophidiicola TaxID=1387563 RepID=A0ACB8V3Y5_9EURO|nr:dodecenoyl-CoA isomerase [Ophidiomyces ophidiicola]KAI1911757.1 dodecenoyl-CoA isomerase [Ophidiomyces ophidiicola]KAI1914041.1 dodecenoyl-CoA isomerase [Ophidiomyces ophidiicola]KAI1929544.1 dodecenoyl-CoA isomerase [Ophidiomyces ophidiicola]KAI1943397.1 dodecenoyl-CoA isomerase [Ophidiomyces ophidiicola]KAI1951186.1 dodecenoyl-CoA isomerase [Ophidiomyces ophidiicola]